MAESAEDVAANLTSKRNVTVEISNITSSYCLINPRVFLDSGEIFSPPQPTVRPLRTEVCVFSKGGGATGAVGVLTYDLLERGRDDAASTLSLMFSVPWDYNLYHNWLAVGLAAPGRPCDHALYKEMYYDKAQTGFVRQKADGSGVSFAGGALEARATMSPCGHAIMKVEVWDALFSPPIHQAY